MTRVSFTFLIVYFLYNISSIPCPSSHSTSNKCSCFSYILFSLFVVLLPHQHECRIPIFAKIIHLHFQRVYFCVVCNNLPHILQLFQLQNHRHPYHHHYHHVIILYCYCYFSFSCVAVYFNICICFSC